MDTLSFDYHLEASLPLEAVAEIEIGWINPAELVILLIVFATITTGLKDLIARGILDQEPKQKQKEKKDKRRHIRLDVHIKDRSLFFYEKTLYEMDDITSPTIREVNINPGPLWNARRMIDHEFTINGQQRIGLLQDRVPVPLSTYHVAGTPVQGVECTPLYHPDPNVVFTDSRGIPIIYTTSNTMFIPKYS